ncbi:pyranose dehydrogenase [Mycena leptocephala]|nr:pyranose dehydrogenase [Mycena leptocephala]
MLAQALVTLAYLVPCFCKVYDDIAHLPGLSYDFVILGGTIFSPVRCGTAGNVVANRLTENPAWSVLVLEAGVSNEGVIDSIVPFLVENLVSQPNIYEWNYTTVPQPGLNGRNIGNSRVTGDPGWSWDRLLPYFFKHVIEATEELRGEWAFNLDMNSGKPLGLGWLQSTIGGGERSSSATSYLGPQFIHRENLHVLLHAQVSKLVDPGRVGGKLTFAGVQFAQGNYPLRRFRWYPKHSFAQWNRRQATLTDLGIPTLLDLPSVGRNASDQPLFGAGWFVNSTKTLESITQNATRFNEAFAQWNRSHTAGPDSPHIEVAWGPGSILFAASNFSMGAGIAVLNPISQGAAIRQGPTWRDYIIAPIVDLENMSQDALDEYIRNNAQSASHLVGTAAMSAKNARYGVVDPDLRVKGAVGLRIIDASVFPFVPSGHTQAATYAIAERGADLVKEAWK